jgi:hypothetical protein
MPCNRADLRKHWHTGLPVVPADGVPLPFHNTRPLGIAEYQLAQSLPEPLQANPPTIEQIERELAGGQTWQR